MSIFPQLYVYIFAGIFVSTLVLETSIMLYRNGLFRSKYTQAVITRDNGTIRIIIHPSRPIRVDAGKYINLWIRSGNFWSLLQSHPFVVTSWEEGKQNALDVFIKPCQGLTGKLLIHEQIDGHSFHLAWFSGPRGISAPVVKYESILMVASGFGIAALLPYLKQLIYRYNTCRARIRRIHLAWQLQAIGKP
jgi:NAD(P)H-flavin reductase